MFISATMSPPNRELIKRYSREPKTIRMEQKTATVAAIEQWYYEVQPVHKVSALLRLIDYHGFRLGIIFCNTQRMVDELTDTLIAQGFSADRLHGGIPQHQRTRVMNKFKKAEFEFLVATDVAARGIDVDDLELVVNYDIPYDSEDYVHRIGRTGRAGRRGMAITLVSGRDIYKLPHIERFTRTRIHRGQMPTLGEVEGKRMDALLQKVRLVLNGTSFASQMPLVDTLLQEGFASTDIAAALFVMATGTEDAAEARPGNKPPAVVAATHGARPDVPSMSPSDGRRLGETPRPTKMQESSSGRAKPPAEPRQFQQTAKAITEIKAVPQKHVDVPPPSNEEPIPVLRLAPRGSQWVRLSVGWQDKINPRAIVALLGERLGAPAPRIGMIELTETQSFAQVGKEHLSLLMQGPVGVESEFGPVTLSLLPEKHTTSDKHKPHARGKHKGEGPGKTPH